MPIKDQTKGKYVNVVAVGESSHPMPNSMFCKKQHYFDEVWRVHGKNRRRKARIYTKKLFMFWMSAEWLLV